MNSTARNQFTRTTTISALTTLAAVLALNSPTPTTLNTTTTPTTSASITADNNNQQACSPGAVEQIPGPPPILKALDATPGTLPYTGKGVLVAIIDSGIDATRPQLASALTPGSQSLIRDDARPDGLGDPFGHGTAVAGIIAARPKSGSGVTGIAPEAKIISIRVFSSTDEQAQRQGTGPDTKRLAAGINEATRLGANIIVVAMSDTTDTPELRAASKHAYSQGSLIVSSAGNRSTTEIKDDSPRYPAAYPETLAVTAVTLQGRPSNNSIHGTHVDVAAPGQHVLTTATGAGDCLYANDAPSSSFATAYTAGTAALIAQAYPDEGPEKWMYRLKASADRPDPDNRDNLIGWGRISPNAALKLRPDRLTRGPASPFTDTSDAPISRPLTHVTSGATAVADPTLAIISAALFGGLISVLALITHFRQRRNTTTHTKPDAGDHQQALPENTDTADTDPSHDDHPYGPVD